MRSCLLFLSALLLSGGLFSLRAEEKIITYTLPKDGKVSLAVYNAEGQMVRTLRNAEPQKAGEQRVRWDGLDQNGNALPAGDYHWKLLLSQGMKAEFLINLGTSLGIQPWVGQHGGPYAVAVEGDSFMVGSGKEVAPLLAKAKLEGGLDYALDYLEFNAARSVAIDRGIAYVLMVSGRVFALDFATGKKLDEKAGPNGVSLLQLVRELEPIPPMAGSKSVTIPVGEGRFLLQVTAGQENAASAAFKTSGSFNSTDFPATEAGKFTTKTFPSTFHALNPVKGVNGELNQTFNSLPNDPEIWAVSKMELLTPPESLDARFGEVVVAYPALRLVAWLDPKSGEILKKVEVPGGVSGQLVLTAPGQVLAITGNALVKVSRAGSSEVIPIPDLIAPKALAFDPTNGGLWIADAGASQQVKFFDSDLKLQKTFGRKGGRLTGVYVPENFSEVSSLAADGKGGFLITEANSAPRRTARFDGEGRLIREWFGGQQFYTFAAPDPEDADIFWMDSQWGWIMKVQADWDNRTWKVLATYGWGGGHPADLVDRYKMAQQHHVKKLDLDKDGQKETYLYGSNGLLQKVDEKAGKLRAVSQMAMVGANRSSGWDKTPLEKQPKPWVEAVALLGKDPAQELKNYRVFTWADANGDYEYQADEFRLVEKGNVAGRGGFEVQDDLSILKSASWGNGKADRPPWNRYPLQGFTASGAPIWDWTKSEPFSVAVEANSKDILVDPQGDIYQILFRPGDGFKAMDTYGMGHGFDWPANLVGDTSVGKWDPAGKLLWQVGSHAYTRNNAPGQLHSPVHFAGRVNGTIGVCDKIVQPVTFWTEDGLYAGSLFDRRADDGLPARVYQWWTGGTDDYHPETGRALMQYDMHLGGSLIQRSNGDVIFIGSGWNNCPAFRVTGWDEFERQSGMVKVAVPTASAAGQGTGLKGEFFNNAKGMGMPAYTLTTPRLWFETPRSKKARKPDWNWPTPPETAPAIPSATSVPATASVTNSLPPPAAPIPVKKPSPTPMPLPDAPAFVRWTGQVEPRFSEDYTFALYQVAGSARLWVDGQLVSETGKGAKVFSKPIALMAGKKASIKVEWKGSPAGELHLSWASPSQSIEHIPPSALYPD